MKDKTKKPLCKWRDQFDFCHCINQLGDNCEGKCPAYEYSRNRFKSSATPDLDCGIYDENTH